MITMHKLNKIIVLLFVFFSAKTFCQNMIIINSNNHNNVIALDKTSSAVTFILKSNLSKIKFDSLNSNSESKILVGINNNLEDDEFVIKSNNSDIFIEAANSKFLRYTDSTGSNAINNPLSLNRANAARNYLVSRGVSGSRIVTSGMGSSQPIASNATEAGRAQNRRVEIYVAERPR